MKSRFQKGVFSARPKDDNRANTGPDADQIDLKARNQAKALEVFVDIALDKNTPVYLVSSWRLVEVLHAFKNSEMHLTSTTRVLLKETIKFRFNSTKQYLSALVSAGLDVTTFHPPLRFKEDHSLVQFVLGYNH